MAEETRTDEARLERLVDLAKEGQKDALEELVREIQGRIYNLALRILFCLPTLKTRLKKS